MGFTWNHRVSLDTFRENAKFIYQFYANPIILTNKMADTQETTPTTTETTPEVVETPKAEETPKETVEETKEEAKEETNGEAKNGDSENGHKNGDSENGHSNGNGKEAEATEEDKEATKRKAEEAGDTEPVPVSAEKIAKLKETTEETETKEAETA